MKILQLIQKKQLRGAEMFASQLSLHLRSEGHEVRMIALETGDATLPVADVEVFGASPGRYWDWKIWRAIADLIHEWNPDIVQANAGDTLRYAAMSRKLFSWNNTLIFRNANLISRFMNHPLKRLYYKWLLCSFDGVASVSHHCRSDFIRLFKWPVARIHYLPIGLEVPFPASYNSWSDAGLPFTNEPVLLHCGAMVPEKNHSGLLRIFKHINRVIPETRLLLIGTGKLKEQVMERIRALNLEKQIYITAPRTDILKIMALCDALVMPSEKEGLPGVILEAFGSHLPVIAYAVGGIPEVVIQGETGWLIQAGDENDFAETTIRILQAPASTISVAHQANDLVNKDFLNADIAGHFIEFYEKIMNGCKSNKAKILSLVKAKSA